MDSGKKKHKRNRSEKKKIKEHEKLVSVEGDVDVRPAVLVVALDGLGNLFA